MVISSIVRGGEEDRWALYNINSYFNIGGNKSYTLTHSKA